MSNLYESPFPSWRFRYRPGYFGSSEEIWQMLANHEIFRATCSILGWDPREKSLSASVGELNANCEAKIMAEDGVTEILERNKRGELWVRAQNVMKGYWRNPKATQETKTEDGWLRTGDICFVDDEGKFHVVDRMKVSGGHAISPRKAFPPSCSMPTMVCCRN